MKFFEIKQLKNESNAFLLQIFHLWDQTALEGVLNVPLDGEFLRICGLEASAVDKS